MREEAGSVEPRIVALADRLREVDSLQSPDRSSTDADSGRTQMVQLRGPDGREFVETVVLHSRETLVQATDKSAYAVVGDSDGDEDYRIRIWAATRSGVRLVHEESPISPRVHPFGTGILWIRRDAARRPHRALWWDHALDHPALLLDEPDRTHRLDLRSVAEHTAILASRGPEATGHWVMTSRDGATPACRPLAPGTADADAVAWRGDVAVLDRKRGRVRAGGVDPFETNAPDEFVAEHLETSRDALVVVGRRAGRQAIWMPKQGPTAVWTAPPAGTMLPSFDPVDERPVFLVSSPVHKPQVVRPDACGEVRATSTGRADVLRLTAESDDGTLIPITFFLPPGPEAHPLVVHVYGAYGISLEGRFDPFTDDLLAHGVAVAFCHVRGGGENSPQWHRQATGAHRYRSIEDLLTCLGVWVSMRPPGLA